MNLEEAKAKVDSSFAAYGAAHAAASLIPPSLTAGKMYEAWILALVLERLVLVEGFEATLIGSSKVHLKSSPGPINPNYPRFQLSKRGVVVYDVWTDIEFTTLSYAVAQDAGSPGPAHRHELDIVLVPPGTSGYPRHDMIVVGVECKNTPFTKAMARAALGIRRELSLLKQQTPTSFQSWPAASVPAAPASVLLVYSTDAAAEAYNDAGAVFGVQFMTEKM